MSRGISRIEKIKEEEKGRKRQREKEEEEKKNRGRKSGRLRKIASFTAPSHVPFDRSSLSRRFFYRESISDGISRERKYPPVSRLFPPSLDEIGFRWPPNVFRYSFLIGSLRSTLDLPPPPPIALHFFENVFSHLSFLSFFF